MNKLIVFSLILSIILLSPNLVSYVDAIRNSDLIVTVFAEDSVGKKYLVSGAQCEVTDRFGNLLSRNFSSSAGIVHLVMRSYDTDFDSRITLSCSTIHFEGTKVLEIDEQRYIREEITMKPLSYYVVESN